MNPDTTPLSEVESRVETKAPPGESDPAILELDVESMEPVRAMIATVDLASMLVRIVWAGWWRGVEFFEQVLAVT